MSMLNRGACLAVGIAAFTLALSLLASSKPPLAMAAIILGSLWFAGLFRGWPGVTEIGLFLFVALTVVGILLYGPLFLHLFAVACALAAWDLDRYARRPARRAVPEEHHVERAHLVRLLTALGVGMALGLLSWLVRVSLSFLWALALGSIAVYGLYRSSILWQREPDE